MQALRRQLIREIEAAVGRHEESAVYGGEPGDPGLVGGPTSVSWEIHGDLASVLTAGGGAILMELLHPSVMAGVHEHSAFRTDPQRRTRNTLGFVLQTTFANTRAATALIERVKRLHARVEGVRPDGVPYRALDPELLAWVHTCIPWAVMTAFDRYRRPLTAAEKDGYLREQAVIGRMSGADCVPETMTELEDFVNRIRPELHAGAQFRSFLGFLDSADPVLPKGKLARLERWRSLRGSMLLMPSWARRESGTEVSVLLEKAWLEPSTRLSAKLIRWALPEAPCKRLALRRMAGARPKPESRVETQ